MAANTSPIYSINGTTKTSGTVTMPVAITTATADYTGASANHQIAYTAGANGGYIARLRFKALGTNIATVARIYINNSQIQTTGSNNVLYGEVSLPAITATNTAATAEIDYPMGFAIEATFRIYVGLATTVASGWVCTAIGGAY